MKFVQFPEERPQTFYFAPGEAEQTVRFEAPGRQGA